VHGTVDEVIAQSHLVTYVVSGEGIGELAANLERAPGIDMVAPFGTSLHVSGRDEAALEAAIRPYRADARWHWERSQASLEDVFIDLMGRARDNFQDAA
jgi:ABC-2 type transport system ATP-binding protein